MKSRSSRRSLEFSVAIWARISSRSSSRVRVRASTTRLESSSMRVVPRRSFAWSVKSGVPVEVPNSVPVLQGVGDCICAEIVGQPDAAARDQRRAQPERGLFSEEHELLTAS